MRIRLIVISILGISLILSATIFGIFLQQSRLPSKTIRVVGSAMKPINSDIIKWRITIVRNTGSFDLKTGYNLIKKDLEGFTAFLKDNGLSESSGETITVQPVNTNPVYGQYKEGSVLTGYSISQSIYLISRNLAKVETLALNPVLLTDQGILIQSSNLEYYYSGLSDIKKELLAEATKDAQKRAVEIAKSSGDKITKIESARVGVFQITEPYSTEVSDYGIYNTSTKAKDITVTINVVFQLK